MFLCQWRFLQWKLFRQFTKDVCIHDRFLLWFTIGYWSISRSAASRKKRRQICHDVGKSSIKRKPSLLRSWVLAMYFKGREEGLCSLQCISLDVRRWGQTCVYLSPWSAALTATAAAAACASAQHCTGMTSWPNTIHCPAYDDIMSFGIKSFATEGVGTKNC